MILQKDVRRQSNACESEDKMESRKPTHNQNTDQQNSNALRKDATWNSTKHNARLSADSDFNQQQHQKSSKDQHRSATKMNNAQKK